MPEIDPLRLLYRFYNQVSRLASALARPLDFVSRIIESIRRVYRRNVQLEGMGDWSPIRKVRHGFYWIATRPAKLVRSGFVQRSLQTLPFRLLSSLFGWLFRVGQKNAFWAVLLAAFIYRWMVSRKWASVFMYGLPTLILFSVSAMARHGSRMDRTQLAQSYLDLVVEELDQWAKDLNPLPTSNASGTAVDATASTSKVPLNLSGNNAADATDKNELSDFNDLLCRRISLLKGQSDHGYYVLGLSMFQRGANASAKRTLSRVAPENEVKYPPAHGLMACILIKEMATQSDPTLLPRFQHHATAARNWPHLPVDVLAASAELYWMSGDQTTALKMLGTAAATQPEFYLLYYERAMEAGLTSPADSARERGIAKFKRMLETDPNNENIIMCLAGLECARPDGIPTAIQVLVDANSKTPSPMLQRAISEVYLKQFSQCVKINKSIPEIIAALDSAMSADPANPNVADKAAQWMAEDQSNAQKTKIASELNHVLVAGNATTATHALLAEYYLSMNQPARATTHLEQVHRVAPTAAKYSNRLAYNYAASNQLSEALDVCNRSLSLLTKREMLGERYVDDLLDTLGKVYQKQNDFEKAILVYKSCLQQNPNRPETRKRLAKLYRNKGDEVAANEQEQLIQTVQKSADKQQALLDALSDPSKYLKPSVAPFNQPVKMDSGPQEPVKTSDVDDSANSTHRQASEGSSEVPRW